MGNKGSSQAAGADAAAQKDVGDISTGADDSVSIDDFDLLKVRFYLINIYTIVNPSPAFGVIFRSSAREALAK
jgi:hypothetical protein